MTSRYDPTTRTFWEHRTEVFRALRDEHPVLHDTERNVWLLTRFEDLFTAAGDPETYSSAPGGPALLLPMLNFLDAPRHTELRRLVSRAFTPTRTAGLEPLVAEVVDQLIDGLVDRGQGDLIADFSGRLAATVVGRLIGIPEERIDEFRHLTEQLMLVGGADGIGPLAARIYAMFTEVVAERRGSPADDLISALIALQREGALSDEELLGFCFLLVGGGNDTTTNLIANGWVLLHDNPDQLELLRHDRSLLPGAIEEMLRMEPPAESHTRTVTRQVDLHGVAVPRGACVQMLWGAGNLDDREFEDPDVFNIRRRADRHLAFGHGPHFCLGAALGRLEARLAFTALLDRLASWTLVERPERVLSPWACAWESVEVLDPSTRHEVDSGVSSERLTSQSPSGSTSSR